MKLSEKQRLFTLDVARLILKAEELGIGLTFGEAHRTTSQQWLYYNGKTINITEGVIADSTKKSWTMNSKHLSRLAVDFNFFVDGELTYGGDKVEELGDYWESLDAKNEWGGHWDSYDVCHFQRNT